MTYNCQQTTIGKICNVVTDGSHYSPKSVTRGEYMVSVKDFTPFGFDFSGCRQISKSDYDDLVRAGCVPEKDDILIGKDGARFFEDIVIYRQPQRPALLSSIAILRANKTMVEPEYLYYMLKSPLFKKDVRENYGSGSAIPRIILKDFRRMPVEIPPLPVQKQVAAILSALDGRIANNSKINHHLEQMAQAQFERLLIEECADNPLGILADIAEINPPRSLSRGEEAVYVEMANLPTRGSFPTAWTLRQFTGGMKFANGDTIMARITPCLENGKTAYINFLNEGSIAFGSTEYIVIAPKAGYCSEMFYFLARYPDFVSYAVRNMNGSSGRQRVSGETIGRYELRIPTQESASKFAKLATPIMDNIRQNALECRNLAALRDTLLPRLMSGELPVADI